VRVVASAGWPLRAGLRRPRAWPSHELSYRPANAGLMADRTSSRQGSRRQLDLATRRAGTVPARRARQLQIGNPVLRWLARAAGIRTRDQAWRIGAIGEVKVGARLDRLRRHGWRVLHSVPLGRGGDIDHLIIGPRGVFTANTKHHRDARVNVGRSVVFVRGYPVTHIGKSLREASRVQAALSAALGRTVTVEPLVIIHGASVSGWLMRRPRGVKVLPTWAATWWLRMPGHRSGHLRRDEIGVLYAAARTPVTWRRA
jgi:hypothetical protein